MATTKNLSTHDRIKFAMRHRVPPPAMIDRIMQRLPGEVILTRKGQPDRRVAVKDLNPREFGKLVMTIFGEMCREE